jgi:tripartite ATP-independent transporter DctM subunit
VATVAAAAGFAAATGASMASAAAMSKIAVPEMEKHGYQRKLALGTVASGGTLAGVIPPSIGLIIYGMITEVSIARLLIAGILPGIMIACLLSIFIVLRVRINPQLAPVVPEVPFREKLTSLRSIWGIVVVIFCVLGSLYFGITTPTEAAAFGAMGALIIALALKRVDRKNAKQSLFDTGRTTAMIMLILVCGTIFSRFLTMSGLPDDFTGFIKNINLSPMAIITAIGITYLILGMFLDQLSITVITLPVFFPLVVSLGFDPVWFGIFFDVLTNLGQITPPIGLVCFVIKGSVPNCTLEEVFAGVAPFFIVEILAIIILTIFPKIATFLPSLMMQ